MTIDLKAVRAAAEAAPYEAPWRYEPTGQTVWAGNTYMVADIRGWGHLQYLPNGKALQDATGVFIATANPATVIALCDEIERLTACLKKANDQAEHFEREWYLRGDRLEAAEKDVARLDYIESNCEGKLLRKYKKKWSFMPVCCNYEYPVFPNLRDALDYSMKDEQK